MPTLNKAFVAHLGREAVFQDRSTMRRPFVGRSARLPVKLDVWGLPVPDPETKGWVTPATPLPVDSSGDGKVSCPADANAPSDDYSGPLYGDCGLAMMAHADNIRTFRAGAGKQSTFDVRKIVAQYLRYSGGDNGLGEAQVVAIGKAGVGGDPEAVIWDALDIDLTDTAMVRHCIYQFATVQKGWSVPNAFINGFATGSIWSAPGRPNPMHGHYTVISDVGGPATPIPSVDGPTGGGRDRRTAFDRAAADADLRAQLAAAEYDALVADLEANRLAFRAAGQSLAGYYRDWTWGGWCWESPAFVASVNPDGFVAISPRLYDPTTGLDWLGRHVRTQAALWEKMGGHPVAESILAKYPDPVAPAADDWSSWE